MLIDFTEDEAADVFNLIEGELDHIKDTLRFDVSSDAINEINDYKEFAHRLIVLQYKLIRAEGQDR